MSHTSTSRAVTTTSRELDRYCPFRRKYFKHPHQPVRSTLSWIISRRETQDRLCVMKLQCFSAIDTRTTSASHLSTILVQCVRICRRATGACVRSHILTAKGLALSVKCARPLRSAVGNHVLVSYCVRCCCLYFYSMLLRALGRFYAGADRIDSTRLAS